MDSVLKIALILTAFDKMSGVLRSATSDAQRQLQNLAKENLSLGNDIINQGVGIIKSMAPAVTAYSKLEAANADLQASMMDSAGAVDSNFSKISDLAESLGNQLPGTTADFYSLFQTLQSNGVKSKSIIEGVGEAASYLAIDIKMPYVAAGEFAARMKEATGVADSEMLNFMDTISRANALGIGASEMQYAFSRSAGSLKLLGLQGLQASNDMTVFYASLIRAGMSGETAASSFNNIVSSILDPKKFNKFQGLAGGLGINFKFFDDKGKFMGVENMVAQFDKMKNLSTAKKAELVQALTGGGSDGQALNSIILSGTAGYQKMRAEMEAKAKLNDKINIKLKTLSAMWEATTGTIENMLASLGAGLAPLLKPIVDLIGRIAGKLKDWLTQNPALAKFISMAISMAGVAVTLVGVIKVIQAIRIAMMLLNTTLLANPFILIATVAIVAISLIYANWGKISAWFGRLWQGIKDLFWKAVDIIKNTIMILNPILLIYKYWDKIVPWFKDLFTRAKAAVIQKIKEFFGIDKSFEAGGMGLVKALGKGMLKLAFLPVTIMSKIAGKIRRLLPFSPAKEGALRDIDKIKLIETIAESIRPNSLVSAVGNTLDKVKGKAIGTLTGTISAQAIPFRTNQVGGGVNFNVTVNLTGGASKQDAQLLTTELKKQFSLLMAQYKSQQSRISF